jgi:hypothetical protein
MKRTDITLFEQYALEKGIKEGIEGIESNITADQDRVTYAPYRLRWAREVVTPFADLRTQIAMANVEPAAPTAPWRCGSSDNSSPTWTRTAAAVSSKWRRTASRPWLPDSTCRRPIRVTSSWCRPSRCTPRPAPRLDFKGMDLKIQGVVVNHDGKSGVLLNGDVYEEGDYVSDELLVKLVEEDQIWFVFRGLTLVRTM